MDIYRGIGVDGKSVSFVVGDADLPIDTFTEALEKFSGTPVGEPAPGTIARKIATVNSSLEIAVVQDGEEITVKAPTGRAPRGDAGTWTVQSILFEKAMFDATKAKAWIADHGDYGDYGTDEDGKFLRFRQFDPSHFSKMRVVKDMLGKGVTVVYGQVGSAKQDGCSEEDVTSEIAAYLGLEEVIKSEVEAKVSEKVAVLNKSLIDKDVIGWGILNKADEERGIATGVVIEAGWDDKKFDTDNESATKSVVEETAYDWLANSGAIDFMHSFKEITDEKVEVVESWVTRDPYKHGDYDVSVGTWMMSSRFDTSGKYWAGIKAGKLQAWSPGGLKRYVELED
jgi:hypothetical protein